ncbi:MAG TPA: glutathione S-transferase family protein [Acetobacteraceae bacterium]|jgi:glutathione S-transferase|nr:glutathione S-transferase family protein [Acetobacteraceae bacterium]
MLRLLGRATSGNVQKVIFGMEEMGLSYEREDYGRQFGNTATPEYAALNPTRKVPTLVDGDVVVWESNTILRYLAAKSASPLYPSDLAARSEVERWMDWLLAALNPCYLAGFRDAKKPAAERGVNTVSDLLTELAVLEGAMARDWTTGAFSLADIALGPIVRRCLAFPFDRPKLPRLEAWHERLERRSAFARAVAAG